MAEPRGQDIRNIIDILDNFAAGDEGRMKIVMADNMDDESTSKQYHLGRCDVGSPWVCGGSLDALDVEF